jgi:hypothetical protein
VGDLTRIEIIDFYTFSAFIVHFGLINIQPNYKLYSKSKNENYTFVLIFFRYKPPYCGKLVPTPNG